MPWHIEGNSVVNSETGKVKGHSKNPKKYLAALYANVPEARKKKKKKKETTSQFIERRNKEKGK